MNATDYFQFVPAILVAVGWRGREQITLPIRPCWSERASVCGQGSLRPSMLRGEPTSPWMEVNVWTTTTWSSPPGPSCRFPKFRGRATSGGGGGFTQSICSVDHAQEFWGEYQKFLENPGPVVIGAMPGASCFGPAYEFAFILDTDLRKRKLRQQGADYLCHQRALHRPSGAGWRG